MEASEISDQPGKLVEKKPNVKNATPVEQKRSSQERSDPWPQSH
ncbi:MAG: hypothetical protein ACLVIZ_02015 [Bifidobacterium pseudocatenulatum]